MEEKALHFDINFQIYDKVRPGYQNEIYETISNYGEFTKISNILEIGTGNGIASQEIYKKWSPKLTLIEPGKNLYDLLKSKFGNIKDIKIHNTTFENYQSEILYDAIFSATAFHWVDLSVKYKKSYEMLKNNGLLILYWNNYGIENVRVAEEIQKIYVKYGHGTNDSKSVYKLQLEKIEERKNEIQKSGYFEILEHKIVKYVKEYESNDYIHLLKTFSDHEKMEERFFEEIMSIIQNNENRIDVRIITNLEIAVKI